MRKILLADDSVTAQNMGRKILVDAGYEVLTVNNGSAALKRIAESKPDVIILDVYMPGYSGLELCQRLKDSPETAHIPVLLSVGKLEPFKPQEARRVKANAHIIKPFEASELLTAIAHLEDAIVPQGRRPVFAGPVANGDDLSWSTAAGIKNDPQFPPSKKKDNADGVARFRDFRKNKANAAADSAPAAPETASAAPAGKSSALSSNTSSEMPRGITKEELDVLSAVAAKLDEPAIAAPIASPAAQAAFPSASEAAALAEEAQMIAQAARAKFEEAPPLAEQDNASVEIRTAEMPVLATAQPADIAGGAIEIPAEHVEPAGEIVSAPEQAESQEIESHHVDSQPPLETTASDDPVSAAAFAIEPAPIDPADEPAFAAFVAKPDSRPFEVVAGAREPVEASEDLQPAGQAMPAEAVAQTAEEVRAEEVTSNQAVMESSAATADCEAAAVSQEAVEHGVPAPSEHELAEALRLLTPAATQADANAPAEVYAQATGENHDHSHNANGDNVHESGDPAQHGGSDSKSWHAEAVSLTPEEAAISLEAEMFRSFAAESSEEIDAAPACSQADTITAAVETRLLAEASALESDEAPKAMAAAAAEGSTASEDGEIASIVDKVLADLRPRIVEEIAKKLGKPAN